MARMVDQITNTFLVLESIVSANDIFNCFVTVLNLLPRTTVKHRSICWFVQFFFFFLINTYELQQLFHPVICRIFLKI